MGTFLRLSVAAKRLGVSAETLRKWIRARLVPAHRTPTGNWMLAAEDVEKHVYKEVRPR